MWHSLGLWFSAHEWLAIWLEGVALVFIFGLDYMNRRDARQDRKEQQEETSRLIRASRSQAYAARQQADFASESLNLLKRQAEEQQLRELWRVLPLLDDVQAQVQYWLGLFSDQKWNSIETASKILPVDSSIVMIQAARHSNELWTEVRETFRTISNAEYQIDRYYSQDRPAYRQQHLITVAHENLKKAEPKLTLIVDKFRLFEETERLRNAPEKQA